MTGVRDMGHFIMRGKYTDVLAMWHHLLSGFNGPPDQFKMVCVTVNCETPGPWSLKQLAASTCYLYAHWYDWACVPVEVKEAAKPPNVVYGRGPYAEERSLPMCTEIPE